MRLFEEFVLLAGVEVFSQGTETWFSTIGMIVRERFLSLLERAGGFFRPVQQSLLGIMPATVDLFHMNLLLVASCEHSYFQNPSYAPAMSVPKSLQSLLPTISGVLHIINDIFGASVLKSTGSHRRISFEWGVFSVQSPSTR